MRLHVICTSENALQKYSWQRRYAMVQVGDRLSYDARLCTVRYVGAVSAWGPNIIAYGVEWDDPQNGKHSGTHGSVTYFETEVEGAGSFVKSTKRMDGKRTFYQALVNKYGDSLDELDAFEFGNKVVESYGFHKLTMIKNDFQNLKDISLDGELVYGESDFEILSRECPNLTKIDLSKNMFRSLTDVIDIAIALPKVDSIKLNWNRFGDFSGDKKADNITSLSIAGCRASTEFIMAVCKRFPKLDGLNLAQNDISSLPQLPEHISSLIISHNRFQTLPHLPSVSNLDLSNNQVSLTKLSENSQLKTLDLRRNDIKEWSEIDELCKKMPNLETLRINHNPVFVNEDDDLVLIGKMGQLKSLNGTQIDHDQRESAELLLISKVQKGQVTVENDRWLDLVKKYTLGKIKQPLNYTQSTKLGSKVLRLVFHWEDKRYERLVLSDITIRKLKGMASRVCGLATYDIVICYKMHSCGEEFTSDIAFLSSYNLDNGADIFIKALGQSSIDHHPGGGSSQYHDPC